MAHFGQKQPPKYNFGLLETPFSSSFAAGDSSTANVTSSSDGNDGSSSVPTKPSRSFPGWSTTRPGSSSVPTKPSRSFPGWSTTGPGSSSVPTKPSRPFPGWSTTGPSSYTTGANQYTSNTDTSRSFEYGRHCARTPGPLHTPYTAGSSTTKTPTSRRTPYTTSSATPGMTPRHPDSSTLVAIVEGRGQARGEVGMASMDLKSPELRLSQFSDMQTYVKTITKLQILQPLEIVLPSTACEAGTMTELSKLIHDQFTNTSISTVQRKYFNETKGLTYVKQLCVPEYNSVQLEVAAKYYCLAAGAALMKYVEFIQNMVYAPGSLKVVFTGSENTTMIDVATVRNLELLQNLRDPRSDHTLYGILNYTKTVGGARLLRSNILQPPSDVETITLRQDVVAELTEKEAVFYSLQAVVSRFLDIDHLLSGCVQLPRQENVRTAEAKITNVMYLKHTLELVEPLREALGNCENPLLKASYKLLEDPRFGVMMNKINAIIHEEARYQKGALNMRSQKCFAVKPKINGLLDLARRTYTEIVDDITILVNQLAVEYSLPMKVAYSTTRGFYIQLYSGPSDPHTPDSLPGRFIKVTKMKNMLSFTTTDLIKLNDRVKESLDEIYIMTSVVMTELLNVIRDDIGCLYKLSETVARLDMLLSFAHACTVSDFVRPEFTDTLAVKQARHPILQRITTDQSVANNIYASEDSNFMIITGPNMSGKSTYLRQISLLQIMAQIGSFVPAEYASFRIASQIFSRIVSDDDLETNTSTFMLEMKEVNYIIQTASSDSLIIIDELGRGTSPEEAVGLCFAICEHLLALKAFTFFVTHFLELTSLDGIYPNVENYHFTIQRTFSDDANHSKVVYTHVLSKGKTEEQHYGIELAEISTMPLSVIEEAKTLALKISKEKKESQRVDKDLCRQRAVFKLATRLAQAGRSSNLDDDSLRAYLKGLKKQYEEEMAAIGED